MQNNFIPNRDVCLPCQNPVSVATNQQIQTNTVYSEGACSTDFIDSALLKYKFGLSYCEGHGTQRWIPSWLLNSAIVDHAPEDLGFPDPCMPNTYYKIIGGNVYAVSYKKDKFGRMKEIERIFLKPARFQDNLIESIDASKIVNRCNFFKNTTLVNPLSDYQSQDINDVNPVLNPNYKLLDMAITADCKLKALWMPKMAIDAVLPVLSSIIKFDPITGLYNDIITPKLTALQAQVTALIANGATGGNTGGNTGGTGVAPSTPTAPLSPALSVGYSQGPASNPPGLANGTTIYNCGVPQLTWGASTNAVSYEVREGSTILASSITGTSYTLTSQPTTGSHTYSIYAKNAAGVYSSPYNIGPVAITTCGTNNGGGGTGTGATGKMYVANAGSNHVSVIDLATNTVTATIAVGLFPKYSPILNSDRTKLYVANVGANTISVINAITNSVIKTIDIGGQIMDEMILSADGQSLFVLNNAASGNILHISTATDTVTYIRDLTSTGQANINYMQYIPARNLLVVGSQGANSGSSTRFLIGPGTLGYNGVLGNTYKYSIYDTAGNYGHSSINGQVLKINLADNGNSFGSSANIGATELVFDGSEQNLWTCSTSNNQIYSLPTSSLSYVQYPVGLAVTGKVGIYNGTKIYASAFGADKVVTFSISQVSAQVDKTEIVVGDGPLSPLVSDTRKRVYVVNKNSNSVSVIDATTNTVIATIPVGINPSSSPVIA